MKSNKFNLYTFFAFMLIVMSPITFALTENKLGNYFDWLIPPILVAASISAIITIFINFINGISNKKRVTIEFLLNMRTNPVLLDNQESFRWIVASGKLPRILNPPQTEEDFKDKMSVQALLNTYELVSIAIMKGVLEENISKEAIGDTLINHWTSAKETVYKLREQDVNNTYFTEFEFVANTWMEGIPVFKKIGIVSKLKKLIDATSKLIKFKNK